MPDSIKEKLLLIGYYGYTYPGHQTEQYRAATQGLLWDTIIGHGANTIFTSARWGEGNVFDVSAEKAEILRLVSHHLDVPSFNAGVYKVQVGETLTLTDTNNVLSEFDISISGAEYSINGNTITIVPTQSGTLNISFTKKMPYTQPYKLFVGNGIQNMLVPGMVDPVIAKIRINSYSSPVELVKKDKETNTTIAQGQATLKGAKYGVYEQATGKLVATIITDENGYAVSEPVLGYKEYYIQEIEPSEGYLLDNTKYNFDMRGKENERIEVVEKVVKNYVSILKQYDFVDGNTTFLNAEEGIKFEIYYPNGKLFDTITTDKNGYATLNIPYGIWKFHQVNTTTGYEKIYDFFITVDYDTESEQYYNILNNSLTSYLQVFKIDSVTGKSIALADTTFKIFNRDKNQYVTQFVGGKVYNEFKTDETGKFMTYLKLESGNYTLYEVSSPKGYLLSEKGADFTIGNNTHFSYTTYGPVITMYFNNTPIRGKIEIYKSGEVFAAANETFNYNGRKSLKDIVYTIYADEDIKTSDGQYIYYEKDEFVGIMTTDANGYAVSEALPLGKYRVQECQTNADYKLDETVYHIELTEVDNKTEVVYSSYDMLNILKKGNVEFTKTDLVDSEPIPNTLMELYTENNELIFRGKTDSNGKITIKNLRLGRYYFLEKQAQTGYLLNEDKLWFEIKEDGEVVKAKMTNERVEGIINIHKDGELPTVENNKMIFKMNSLEGIKFGLYADEDIILNNIIRYHAGDLVADGYTDKNGNLTFDKLFLGKYIVKELETKENYILDTNEYKIELKYKDQYTKYIKTKKNLENYLITVDYDFSKTDVVDDEAIDGTLIELYTENDELIYSGITTSDGKIEFTIVDSKGNELQNKLPVGKFYILEKQASYGYLLNEDKLWFEIKPNDTVVKSNLKDKRVEGIINIHKDGEKYSVVDACEDTTNCFVYETNENLAGVHFGLYAEEDIILNHITRYKKGDLIVDGYTDENGNITFNGLYLGKYIIKELDTISGYILDTNEYYIELEYVDDRTPIIEETFSLKNYLIKGDYEFTKTDISTDEPLPNTLIEIHLEDDTLVYSGYTDENGKIVLKNIPCAKYYLLEVEAPEGYVLNEETMYFEIKENGEIVKANMQDEKIKSTIIIHKLSSDKTVLKGVKIGIFDLDGNLIYEAITDENGNIEVELEYGKYYYQELETIDGYELNSNKIYFEVIEHKAIIESSLINIKVPITGIKDYYVIVQIAGTLIIFIGIGVMIYANKKRK